MESGKNAGTGLSSADAALRLRQYGYNELPRGRPHGVLSTLVEIAGEPMSLLLLACGLVYLAIGDLRDALTLLGFVGVLLFIEFIQERRTEHALHALRALSSPRALVIRDGQRRRVPGRDVVPGDLVVLSEGDRVPADGQLLDAHHIEVDESLLTGESLPVRKAVKGTADATAGVYAGSLLVSGHGVAQITSTGSKTEIGRIGHAVRDTPAKRSPLQTETDALVRVIAVLALVAAAAVALLYGLVRSNWSEGLLGGLALAMTLLPSEFPVVLTVFLGIGAWRLAQRRVLVRRMSALETLGAATVLCVDKTGTLTENRMRVGAVVSADGTTYTVGTEALPEPAHRLVEYAILATRTDPFDPMERAIRALGVEAFIDSDHLHADWEMLREYPLSSELMAMSQVWQARRGGHRSIAAKGAPEAIAELCHLDTGHAAALAEQVERLSAQGLRVIAVAAAQVTHDAVDLRPKEACLPTTQHEFAFELLGLLGLHDPVRETVPAAVRACKEAGIRLIMITGDHPGTASIIAQQAGLSEPERFLLGPELDALDDHELRERLHDVNVIARARPEHKLRVIQALQHNGEVVGMTGDGVNDAPALSHADIGIAMGQRGTDVAREAAALVVADDDFGSIVEAVRGGRRIDRNLRRAMIYLIGAHLPIAGISLISAVLGWPLLLLPTHIAFLELIIDPACSLAFEAGGDDPQNMRRPPRPLHERLFGWNLIGQAILQGSFTFVAAAALAIVARGAMDKLEHVRTLVFMMLVLANLAMIIGPHWTAWRSVAAAEPINKPLWAIVPASLVALALLVSIPALSGSFQLGPALGRDWLVCSLLALLLTAFIASIQSRTRA